MEQGRLFRRHGAREGGGELGVGLDAFPMCAVGLGEGGEVWARDVGGMDAAREVPFLVHADGAVHAVVHDQNHHGGIRLHGCGEFLAGHLVAAIAGEADHGARRASELGGDGGWQTVAHRTGGGSHLRAVTAEAVEAVHPAGIVAGAVGENGVGFERFAQNLHDVGHGEPARGGMGQLGPVEIGLVQVADVGAALAAGLRRGKEWQWASVDAEHAGMHAAGFVGVGVDVNHWRACFRQLVGLARNLGETSAEQEQQICFLNRLAQDWIDADAHIAGVVGMLVVEQLLATEGAGHRQARRFRESRQARRGGRVPRRAANDREGLARGVEEPVALAHGGGVWRVVCRLDAGWRRHVARIPQHVFREGYHGGAGSIRECCMECVGNHGGDATSVRDFGDELGHAAEEGGEVELLERVSPPGCAFHLAGKQHEGRGILLCHVDAGAGVGGAGAAGYEDDAGTARELGVRLRHHGGAALLTRHYRLDGGVAQGIEHRKIALSRHAEDAIYALLFERVHEGSGGRSGNHLFPFCHKHVARRVLHGDKQPPPEDHCKAHVTSETLSLRFVQIKAKSHAHSGQWPPSKEKQVKVALQGRAQGTQKELYEKAGIDIIEGGCRTEDEMIELIGDADGAQVGIMPLTSRRVMESCANLKVVSRFGVGVDSIDIDAATELGVMVCNVPGSNTTEVADHAMSLMLSLTRRIYDAIRTTREGAWADKPGAIGEYAGTIRRLAGHTVGIVGFGNIGRAFATRVRGFGVSRILAYDPYVNQLAADLYGVTLVDFETLVAEADCISVHCSATDESRYLFDADTFRRMKPTALLVNTARGPIVDGEALADALEAGEIEAAALDVTEVEPLPSDNRLLHIPNCYITPHIAAVSAVFRAETAVMQAQNIIRILTGEKPHGLANPEVIKTVAIMRHTNPGRWEGIPDFSTALQV